MVRAAFVEVGRDKQQRQVVAGKEYPRRSAPRLIDRLRDRDGHGPQTTEKDRSIPSSDVECSYPWGCDCGCSRQRDWSVTSSDESDSG